MTKPQENLYWRLWGQVRKVNPAADRHAMHAEVSEDFPHGLPASHTTWGKRGELDEWIKRCAAVTRPADFTTQRRMAGMESARGLVGVRHLLTALGKPESYAEAIVTRMHRNERAEYSGAGSGALLETLDPAGMSAVRVALKKECRRVWPKKEDLLTAIYDHYETNGLEEETTLAAIKKALNRESLGGMLYDLPYEDLLVALSAQRSLARVPVDDGDPF